MKNKLVFDIGEELWLKPGEGIRSAGPQSIGEWISVILPNLYILAGIIMFLLLIGGSLMVIVNAGQDNPEGAAKGKKAVTSALIGFLIIFTSYWLIQIISKITGLDILGGGGL